MASAGLQVRDEVMTPHLRLEPSADEIPGHLRPKATIQFNMHQKSKSKTLLQGTVEADNKRRPGILKQNSLRFKTPPPEPPDPNSEPKSAVIKRMQERLEDWDEKLIGIAEKKKRNDELLREEIKQRNEKISDLSNKYNTECQIRSRTEEERKNLSEKLGVTEQALREYKLQSEQLESELTQCQLAYQETEARKQNLEQENAELYDKLEQIEEMKRRLNDHVTELQGQISMMQRSSTCIIL